jgi:iron complex outermembrane receptor protein
MLFNRKPIAIAVTFALSAVWQTANAQTGNPASHSLDEVVVSDSRIEPAPTAAGTLNMKSLAPMRASTSDTAGLLRNIPGVSLQGAGGVSSLPAIHGMADDRVRTKVDGMDLISGCANHMNPPLSYIDPTNVGSVKVFAGITPVSIGGDSIGGTIIVNSAEPEFAKAGEAPLLKGQAGAFYRSNGNGVGGNLSATLANENLSVTYSGSTAQADNYRAGRGFKNGARVSTNKDRDGHWLSANEVASSAYETRNHALGFAVRHENHIVELKLGLQDIPYQNFPNQRMDMTGNDSKQVNLRYKGQFDWGALEARIYDERTRHEMQFGDDKTYWYTATTPGMPMDTKGRNTGGQLKADIILSQRDTLRVGSEIQRYSLDDWWEPSGTGMMSPNTFWNINDGERNRLAVFAEWEAQWSRQWLTQFGIRHETVEMDSGRVQGYNGLTNTGTSLGVTAFNAADRDKTDHNLDLTLLARYTPDDNRTVEFGYARKTRSPNLYERYTWNTGSTMVLNMNNWYGDGNGYVGNINLKPEVAHTLSTTLSWHDATRKEWGLSLTPYYTRVSDYIDAVACTACTARADGFRNLTLANQDARLYGIDIAGLMPLANNTGLGSFSLTGMINYVNGKNRKSDDDLYNIMPLNTKLALVQKLGQWTNTAEAQFVKAKSEVADIRKEMETDGYALFNLRSSYELKQVRLDVGIDNVFDKFYRHPLGGAYVGQGSTMGTAVAYGTAVPGMGRSFYAGVNYKF